MSEYRLCVNCMSKVPAGAPFCPSCGFRDADLQQPLNYLPPYTVLHGKYVLGRGLGNGGFGITYLAYDTVLNRKLAIKEYLPQDCSSRVMGTRNVYPFSGEYAQRFEYGKKQFLEEARTMVKFDKHPYIVDVLDFFEENGTAYLVMTFLEGVTLRDYLLYKKEPLPFLSMMQIMQPVMLALKDVHRIGILHRDISPDNIFLSTGGVKLIDFGAARQSLSLTHGVSVILKPGYAPVEQYYVHGNQGPWTDIYALAASMYRAITGQVPQESLGRQQSDTLLPPSKNGSDIPREAEQVLLRAMAVDPESRYRSIGELWNAFVETGVPERLSPFTLSVDEILDIRRELQSKQDGREIRPPAPAPVSPPPVYPAPPVYPEAQPVYQEAPAVYPEPAPVPPAEPEETGNGGSPKRGILRIVLISLLVFLLVVAGALWAIKTFLIDRYNEEDLLPEKTVLPGITTALPVPTATPAPADVPTATPVPATPAPTPTLDPSRGKGAVNLLPLEMYLPSPYQKIRIYENGRSRFYLTDLSANGKYRLMAPFDFEEEKITGEISAYWINIEGAYLLTDYASQESETLLPLKCAVGEKFSGREIVAVNGTFHFGTETFRNMVVVKLGEDYSFYAPGIGLYAIRRGGFEGEIIYQIVDSADAEPGLLLRTYEKQMGPDEDKENEIFILDLEG